MNKPTASMLVWFLLLPLAWAQVKQEQKLPQAAMNDMMKRMTELASPSEGHAKLNDLVGVWDAETKMWMGGEGSGQPSISKGTAEYSWVLGGRFLREGYNGEMMGFGFTGYDNYAKKYKVLTLYGKMDEWTTGELGKNVKYVTRIIDRDKHVFEILDLAIGEPSTKVVDITYTRKK